ncbi:LysR substrate-binding domain-containing protein [Streptomyces sp. NPDC006193]|uniref:LysR substrate-binding domain-containing protein n=1 Tax=Streptomyces sp. NPDC006193 TaxID=3155717 RepID=UPI0033A493B0
MRHPVTDRDRRPGHPLAARDRPAAWGDPATEHFFLVEEGCTCSDAFERRLRAAPGAGPPVTRSGSVDAARSCAAAGPGPDPAANDDRRRDLRDATAAPDRPRRVAPRRRTRMPGPARPGTAAAGRRPPPSGTRQPGGGLTARAKVLQDRWLRQAAAATLERWPHLRAESVGRRARRGHDSVVPRRGGGRPSRPHGHTVRFTRPLLHLHSVRRQESTRWLR